MISPACAWSARPSDGEDRARPDQRRGARGAVYGVGAFAPVLAVLVLAAVIPVTSFLDDSRADLSGPELLHALIVSILLTTAVTEELTFRGVLLATGRSVWGDRTAVPAPCSAGCGFDPSSHRWWPTWQRTASP